MQRTITAIYRTHAVANLVRDEVSELGVSGGHITVIPDTDEALAPNTYRDDSDYMDDVHDLHLDESETRTYQQAVRRGDYVVSVNAEDEFVEPICAIMRRPEDAYDIDAREAEFRDDSFIPRNRNDDYATKHSDMTFGERQTEQDAYVRSYTRQTPLGERDLSDRPVKNR